jgi:hypothetical protein
MWTAFAALPDGPELGRSYQCLQAQLSAAVLSQRYTQQCSQQHTQLYTRYRMQQ